VPAALRCVVGSLGIARPAPVPPAAPPRRPTRPPSDPACPASRPASLASPSSQPRIPAQPASHPVQPASHPGPASLHTVRPASHPGRARLAHGPGPPRTAARRRRRARDSLSGRLWMRFPDALHRVTHRFGDARGPGRPSSSGPVRISQATPRSRIHAIDCRATRSPSGRA